ncbi:MAG: TIGR00730 family Rossman fold protein [Rhizobiales bacterium]|nr:TIGR00730 family Rossman fold protein [Hyphomicrobiales bacterium]
MTAVQSICVFCGSKDGEGTLYREAAYQLGALFAKEHIRLVYGGGNLGLMGHVARGALDHGGKVTGIIPHFLTRVEKIGESLHELDEVHITKTMHERKMLMYQKSDAFVALPGGIGTLEELVEQLTWAQLGQHRKPVVLADIDGFWQPFFVLLAHMEKTGFIRAEPPVACLSAAAINDVLPVIRTALLRQSGDEAPGRISERF